MAGKKKLTDKLIKWLWYLVASSILVSAVMISLVRFALTEIDAYQETIEQLASKATNHKIYIESLDAKLVGLMPTLVLKGVHVMDKNGEQEVLRVSNANIGISLLQSIRHQTVVPKDILISGTKLALVRLSNGQVNVLGFDFTPGKQVEQKSGKGLTEWFFSQSSLALKNSTIIWKDYLRNQEPVTFSDINVELYNQGKKHQLVGSFSPSSRLGKNFEVAIDVTGDLQRPAEWKGEFFVQGDEIFLAGWGERFRHNKVEIVDGIVDFQVWGKLGKNGLNRIYGDISAYQLNIKEAGGGKKLDIDLVGGLFEFAHENKDWHLNVNRFQYTGTGGILPETNFSISAKHNDDSEQPLLDIRVDQLDLQGVSEVAVNSGFLTKQYETLLKALSPSGNMRAVRIASSPGTAKKFLAHATLNNVSIRHHEKIPGLKNISGELWLNQDSGKLSINSTDSSADFGKLFRAPLELKKITGTLNWWKFNSGWQLTSTELLAENNEVTTLNNLSLFLPENGPVYMDLYSAFAGSAQYKSNYLPVGIMKEPLVNWLDRSIVSGVISNGGAVYRGRLKDFPYRTPRGQFLVQLYTDNLELDYQKGWPTIKDADFDASFDSKGLNIDLHLARLFSSAVTDAAITIADFREPVVDITGKVTGGMADVVKFVVKSPLNVSKELLDIRYAGRATTTIDLHVPLRKGEKVGYTGRVSLKNGEIQLLSDVVSLKNIKGDLTFANRGFTSDNLTADIFNQNVAINIYSQETALGNKTYLATSGQTDVDLLLKGFSIPAYKHSKGEVDWQALLDFSDDKKKVPVLNVRSELEDVALDMPYPLNKNVGNKKELTLQAYFKGKGVSDIYLKYGKSVSLAGRIIKQKDAGKLERGHIRFADSDAVLPKQKVLYVTGSLPKFYPSRWTRHMDAYKELAGNNRINMPVVLNMDSLSVNTEEKQDKGDIAISPLEFPVVNGSVEELTFDGMPLGKLSIDMIHHKGDMKLNKLNIESPDMDFNSSGRWSYTDQKHFSKLNVRLQSKNLGKLFKRLGLAAIINDGESDIKGSLNWHASPFAFALEKLNGNLRVYIKDGSVADVNPGAGRVVGLLSLSELPRRLMLDFSDMFKKGLVFDEIKGNLTLDEGNAFTKAINVESSVADVKIEGRTGLVTRDYDQLVHVVPKVGDTLPVASGVLFGSQIGALVLLFEKLMGKEIEKATERKYKVTGSWEKPVIERLDKPTEPGKTDGKE